MQKILKGLDMNVDKRLLPRGMRHGSSDMLNDELYIESAVNECERLVLAFRLNNKSKILDIGCSGGKLLIGITESIGDIKHYHGIDVSKREIDWCNGHLASDNYKFSWLNLFNERYNIKGVKMDGSFILPTVNQFDIVYIYSVFSHLNTNDIQIYLNEFKRVLKVGLHIFLTMFVEDNVPDMTINPPDYIFKSWRGPLACVRYSKQYFESLLTGFSVEDFKYRSERSYQSTYYLRKI